ncbi:cobaltochelatase subunit CobN [Azospirillum halopraeferens]|uniref:cobaltochelatase subunit CobN n=1 Tax=Azospirillum halopraeferens TaxID=34010 RepID=UPI00041E905E|nr:cobaltochelatase subunit CobN [Azospirillum halopraeferens]
MHLLATRQESLEAAPQAVDLGHRPADLVVLSFSDSDLGALAAAARAVGADRRPSLRLVALGQLGHPLSVDLYVDAVIRTAKVVVLRLLGGAGYWRYGLEQVAAACRETGAALAVLPGDGRPDPALESHGTVPPEVTRRLFGYFAEGGPDNMANLLAYAATLAGTPLAWAEPAPVPRFGLYDGWRGAVPADAPAAALVFYRAYLLAGDLAPIHALADALAERALAPRLYHVSSLKEPDAAAWMRRTLAALRPGVVLNATGFSAQVPGEDGTPLDAAGAPVLQVVLSTGGEAAWRGSLRGLGPSDLAMNVVLPEMDGRIPVRAVAFKAAGEPDPDLQFAEVASRPVADRIAFTADLAAAWVRLARTPRADRRLALVLSDYPGAGSAGAGTGHAVGLDTPASVTAVLDALRAAGYGVAGAPADGAALMRALAAGAAEAALSLADYHALVPAAVRRRITAVRGEAAADPLVTDGAFRFRAVRCGAVVVAVQPSRGDGPLTTAQHHDPETPPGHGYAAFYAWLRRAVGIHALVQMGAHGTLEWLPGKAVALSAECWPEIIGGPLPCLYPFIVNNPGEGVQARRRIGAVLIGHLTPPPVQAGLHGPLAELEQAIDEYAQADGLDPRRLGVLRETILDLAWRSGVAADCNLSPGDDPDAVLARIDAHLCDVKEMQIRDGLHVFGAAPDAGARARLLAAVARFPRRRGDGEDAALPRALAADLGLPTDSLFTAPPGTPWDGPPLPGERARTVADVRAALDRMAVELVAGRAAPRPHWTRTAAVLGAVAAELAPRLDASAEREMAALLDGLDGRFIAPGPGGSPARGRADALPTGRNLFAMDPRAVPTPSAWTLGWQAADALLTRHLQDHGAWPQRLVVDCWGTPAMRTGGDELAQAMALLGVRPLWEGGSGRVTGFEILPAGVLGRPRVDVTLRISGLFRDVFPQQIALFDQAVRAVAALEDEDGETNPLAAAVRRETAELAGAGLAAGDAARRAAARVFGAAPGGYGTALSGMIARGEWRDRAAFGTAYLEGGCHAYGAGLDGVALPALFRRRVGGADGLIHHQDQREHDVLSHDGHYQYQGGFAAAAALDDAAPTLYHLDSAEPDRLTVRTLGDEIARTLRGRAANPRWIAGMMRHGHRGAAELAATVEALFAFAATTRAVRDHHFDLLHEAYVDDDAVWDFLIEANPAAARHVLDRLEDALGRGLWHPRRNHTAHALHRRREGLS